MIQIKKIIFREIHLPLKEPFVISSGVQDLRRIIVVELEDVDGAIGWSECVADELPNYMPETTDIAWLTLHEWMAPAILSQAFDGPEAVYPFLQKDIRGHFMAKAAVEMGMWELDARKQGISLSKRLGGTRTEIATGISIGIQENPQRLAAKAGQYLAQGYRKIKLKIKPGADVEYVAAVREALGPDAPLMVDANNAYTLDDLDVLMQLDQFNLVMMEQPLAWDDYVQHAELQRRLKTPVCLDESITGIERTHDMLTLKSGRIVNIKPGRVGGFSSSLAIHDLCMKNDIPVWCGGMLEGGIGRAHNVALASLPNFTLPGDVSPSDRYWAQDIVTPEWTMNSQGMVTVPLDQPGMGVEPDLDRIEDLTVKRDTFKL
ncbi:MAG: o-succinylbenzoate synthase [Gammaproteobacteria bacterium]|nr:o-succinylbenzoate synthase [Gammaproteobacteria bacterium]